MTRAKFTREPTRAILMDLFSTGTDVPPLTDIHTKVKADDDFGCLIILDAVYKKRWLACWVYHWFVLLKLLLIVLGGTGCGWKATGR